MLSIQEMQELRNMAGSLNFDQLRYLEAIINLKIWSYNVRHTEDSKSETKTDSTGSITTV
jgi:hypothetical protein